MLWRADLDVTLVNFVEVYIDVWIENQLPRAGCFLTRFYGHWNSKYKQHSWNLLKHIGDNRVLPCASLGISMSYYILMKPPASCDHRELKFKDFVIWYQLWTYMKSQWWEQALHGGTRGGVKHWSIIIWIVALVTQQYIKCSVLPRLLQYPQKLQITMPLLSDFIS